MQIENLKRQLGRRPFEDRLLLRRGDTAQCPFHNGDSKKSFHLKEKEPGIWVGTCFSECAKSWDAIDFVAAYDKITRGAAIQRLSACKPTLVAPARKKPTAEKPATPHVAITPGEWNKWGRELTAADVARLERSRPNSKTPSVETLRQIGCRVKGDHIGFPYHHGETFTTIKARHLDRKEFFQEHAVSQDGLFNLDALGFLTTDVYLVESELDAGVMREAGFDAVSVITSTQKTLSRAALESLTQAERIFLIGDQDKAGQKCMDALANLLPTEKTYRIRFDDAKDVGELAHKLGDGFAERLKSLTEHATPHTISQRSPTTPESAIVLETFNEIESKPVVWLWKDRIPKGKLTIFSGNPDVGKTTVAMDMVARHTTGEDYGDGCVNASQGEVLLMTNEDSASDTLKPRLQAAGADVSRVHLLKFVSMTDGTKTIERAFALDSDLTLLETKLAENRSIDLVIIDPITGYIGRADLNKEQELRRVLTPITELAERTGVTFIGLGHFSKRSDVSALHKVGGAVAMSGVARSVWLFAKDQQVDGQYLMLLGKGNLTKKRTGLKYRIGEKILSTGSAPFIVWGGEAETDPDAALDIPADPKEKASARAEKFLLSFLTEPKSSDDVFTVARTKGIANRNVLFEAKKSLGIEAVKIGGSWYWQPPNVSIQTQSEPEAA